jgi:molybdenum cofactor guanylyltransferase
MTVRPFAGAVLLGGASRRYGTDKALALHGGVAMGACMIEVLRAAGASDVITVGGADRGFDVVHHPDLHPGEGPLGGLLTVLAKPSQPVIVLVACDMPYLNAATVRRLAQTAHQHPESDAIVAKTDRREPLCAAYRAESCRPVAEKLFAAGTRSLQEFLACLKVLELVLDDFAEVRNVNSPEDHVT